MAVDFLGNKIEVGDEVVFVQKRYRNFLRGVISKITEKTVLVEHEKSSGWDSGTTTKQFHTQVIKIGALNELG